MKENNTGNLQELKKEMKREENKNRISDGNKLSESVKADRQNSVITIKSKELNRKYSLR